MADESSEEQRSPINMTIHRSSENGNSKDENSMENEEEKLTACNPSASRNKPTTDTNNPFAANNSTFAKSILKPSLLSVPSTSATTTAAAATSGSATTASGLLRESCLNPFVKSSNSEQSDNSDKKSVNGEVKFVPLIKNDQSKLEENSRQLPETTTTASAIETSTANVNATAAAGVATPQAFVFGENLQERVISDVNKSQESLPSTSSQENVNGSSNQMLFSTAMKTEGKSEVVVKEKERKTLTESAREYEQSRPVKRKYEEVQVKTGEEEETNILSISCKLFSFDKTSSNWQERGRGNLRLNDFEIDGDSNETGSRLVFRAAGSLRVIINTKIWAEMTVDKASEKSIRLTALDATGEIKVFLIMTNIEDSKQLYSQLKTRLEKEQASQKRKKALMDK